MKTPFDVGLQSERTLLACRRTCLALGVASAVIVRFAAEAIGPAAVFLGLAGIALALGGYLHAARRYRYVHQRLHATGQTGSDGRALAFVAASVLVVGAGCIVFIVGAGLTQLT